ncbi:unnamed protein product, partial [marine sediment metagenome]
MYRKGQTQSREVVVLWLVVVIGSLIIGIGSFPTRASREEEDIESWLEAAYGPLIQSEADPTILRSGPDRSFPTEVISQDRHVDLDALPIPQPTDEVAIPNLPWLSPRPKSADEVATNPIPIPDPADEVA